MKKLLGQLAVYLMALLPAGAATYTVTPSQSASAIQAAISGASAGDTVFFAAGTYSVSASGYTLKCGVTYTGPVATPATAILSNTGTVTSQNFTLPTGAGFSVPCPSNTTTIQYFNFHAGGGVYITGPNSNVLIQHNQFTALPCCNTSSNVPGATGIFLDDANTSSRLISNVDIEWNSFGDSTSCRSPLNAMTLQGNGHAPPNVNQETIEGACDAIVTATSFNGLTIRNNVIGPVGEGIHILCYGDACQPNSSPTGPYTSNLDVEFNDFVGVHRINLEEQPEGVQNITVSNNSFHDATDPYYGNFGLSFACCDPTTGTLHQAPNVKNNVLIQNTTPGGPGARYGYGIEAWGFQGNYSNNLIQGLGPAAPAIAWCFGMLGGTISNNTLQGPHYSSAADANGGDGYIGNEGINVGGICGLSPPWSPSTLTGNVKSNTISAVASVAPSISPSPGGYSSPLTVTLTDPGYTSGPQPLGNTSIYYTTDGSTPVPGSGTTQRYTLPITVSLPATIKAVGMWGSGANALSYPSGYGFVPSAVQTAAYAASGGVTLASVSIAPTAGVTNLNIGGTVQMIVTCHYSDGSTSGCNTVDSHGNSVTAWNSSATGIASVNGSGLATGVAIGTATITATVTGGFTPSPGSTLTVSASPLTLTSVTLATAGGVNTITAGTTNQLLGTCHYSDGSTSSCGAAMDSHGNLIGSWNSSVAASATVNGTGNVTGVAAGSTNLSASVTPAPGQLGTNLYTTAGHTANGYINYTYAVTGTATFTPTTCSIYMSGAQTVGDFWDCLLVLAPTPTTQASSPICTARYTITSATGPGANVSFPITGCGTLPPNTAVWVGSTTNQPGTPAQGFNNCGGSCAGGVPTQGSGTYPYYYVPNTFGTYTGMTTQLIAGGATQTSQYVTVTAPPVTSANLPLTVNAAPPTLVSAYLTASGNSLVVPNTLQMAAKCHYSSGADQDCTVADIYGDAVTSWASSDVTKATVNTSGLVTAVAAGTPGITAVINGGPSSTSYSITITNPSVALTGVSLSTAGGVTGLFVGSTNQLKATCTYSDGSSDDCTATDAHGNTAGSYTSSSSSHATVGASTGLVSGIAAGTTNLSATAGSFSSPNLPLTVLAVPTGIYTITIKGPVTFSGTVHF
jgi:uncharacterized protein YjdB